MSMNLNQLRVFHAVAKGGSFTQAAQALSITIIKREAEAGLLRILRIREKGLTRQFQIIIHRERERSRLIAAFLEVAAEAARSL